MAGEIPLDLRAMVCHMLQPLAPEIHYFHCSGTAEAQKLMFVGTGYRVCATVVTKTKRVEIFPSASVHAGVVAARQMTRRIAEWAALASTALSFLAKDGGAAVEVFNPRRREAARRQGRRRSRSCE